MQEPITNIKKIIKNNKQQKTKEREKHEMTMQLIKSSSYILATSIAINRMPARWS